MIKIISRMKQSVGKAIIIHAYPPGGELEGDDESLAEVADRVYHVIVAWLEVGENLRIAVFMVTSPSRKVLIVRPTEVRSGSRRVEHHTCPSGWLAGWLCSVAQGLVVDFPSFEV